jgi:hypothetical protein
MALVYAHRSLLWTWLQASMSEVLPHCKRLAFAQDPTTASARQQQLVHLHVNFSQTLLYGNGSSAPDLCEAWALLEHAKLLLEEFADRPENTQSIWCHAGREQVPPPPADCFSLCQLALQCTLPCVVCLRGVIMRKVWQLRLTPASAMQVTQLQVFVLLCDLITLQDSPSAGPNLSVDHNHVLRVLLQQVPAEAPLAPAAQSMATMLCGSAQDASALESALLEFVMQEQATADVVASYIMHCVAQGQCEVACKGLLQAVQRFGEQSAPLLQCLLNIKVRHPSHGCPARICNTQPVCRVPGQGARQARKRRKC